MQEAQRKQVHLEEKYTFQVGAQGKLPEKSVGGETAMYRVHLTDEQRQEMHQRSRDRLETVRLSAEVSFNYLEPARASVL